MWQTKPTEQQANAINFERKLARNNKRTNKAKCLEWASVIMRYSTSSVFYPVGHLLVNK